MTHKNDNYGNFISRKLPFDQLVEKLRNDSFKTEIELLYQLNQEGQDTEELRLSVVNLNTNVGVLSADI